MDRMSRVFKYGPIRPRLPKPIIINKPEEKKDNPFEQKSLYKIVEELLADNKSLHEEINKLKEELAKEKEENRKERLKIEKAGRMMGPIFPITDGPDNPLIDKDK